MEPFDKLDWPRTVTENGVPRVIHNGTEYREHLILMRHRMDFQHRDLLEKERRERDGLR